MSWKAALNAFAVTFGDGAQGLGQISDRGVRIGERSQQLCRFTSG